MSVLNKIKLTGSSHWSARGELEYEMWYWWLEIDGVKISDEEMREHAITRERGVDFIKKLHPFLPEDIEQKIDEPDSTPGGECYLSFPLKEVPKQEEVEEILREYFPNLIILA